jgi:uncharacterized protein YciI
MCKTQNGKRALSPFIASGRKIPKTGGVILSQLKDRTMLEEIIKKDPFYIHEIADYEIVQFSPGKYHPNFSSYLQFQPI